MNFTPRNNRFLSIVVFAQALSGCLVGAGTNAFGGLYRDNQEADFGAVVTQLRAAPEAAAAVANVVVGVTAGENPELVCVELPSGTVRWRSAFAASSRPEILGDVVLVSNREKLFGFDLRDGRPRFERALPQGLSYVGSARDGNTIYAAFNVGAQGGARRVGRIEAFSETGADRWRHEIQGVFAQPSARASLVFVPWDQQNLSVLSAMDGHEVARLRSTDDTIRFTKTTDQGVYFGNRYMSRFDERTFHGARARSAHLTPPLGDLPGNPEIEDDGFLANPGTRSAVGKIRIYMSPKESSEGVVPAGNAYYFVYYRYLFGYDHEGHLRWARMFPEDILNAVVQDNGIIVVGDKGSVHGIAAETGVDSFTLTSSIEWASASLNASLTDLGSNSEAAPPTSLREELNLIALDPDNRLIPARAYAVRQLAAIPEAEVTRDLLDVYGQRSTPRILREAIGTALESREQGVEFLVAALRRRYDFLEQTEAPPLSIIVPALIRAHQASAVPLLVQQMHDHETPDATLFYAVRGVSELGDANIVPELRRFLIRYHADTSMAVTPETLAALEWASKGVFRLGGDEGRRYLTALSSDARTAEATRNSITTMFAEEEQARVAAEAHRVEEEQGALREARRQQEAQLPERLTQDQVNQVFASAADQLRECVAAEVQRRPELGQVRVLFIVNNDGRASDVGVAPNGDEFRSCMTSKVSALEFPRFRQRRQRASFVIGLRSATAVAPRTLSPLEAVAADAPFWTWTQVRADVDGLSDVEAPPRAWWDRRQAPRRVQTTTASNNGQGGAATTTATARPAWWSASEDGTGATTAPPTATPCRRRRRGRCIDPVAPAATTEAQTPTAPPTTTEAPATPSEPTPTPPAATTPETPAPPAEAEPTPPPPAERPWWESAE